MELTIDTSTRYASVGAAEDGAIVAEITWRSDRNHSVELAPAIRRLMDVVAAGMEDLTAVYVAAGPGGFSALRVGMSTAKAVSAALETPLVAVPTLDVEAEPYRGMGMPVRAVMTAGKTRRYLGRYADGIDPEYDVVKDEETAADVRERTIFCGEGLPDVADMLRDRLGDRAVITRAVPPTRRPGSLAALAHARLQAGETDSADSLQPIYLRSAQVEAAQRAWPG